MASMNGNDNGNSRSPDTVVCESLKVIKNDKNAADSLKSAGDTLEESKKTARAYKICCLSKAEESHGVYQDMMSCITIENYKKTEIIQKSVDEYIKKDDEIEKLIKESSKLLNDLRVKLEEANNAACAMSNCVKNKILPKSGSSTKNVKVGNIEMLLKEILAKTKTLDEKGQNAFESAVTIAGIQTFTNTGSLKDFVAKLMDAMKIFKACVETNIKSTGEDVTKSREELNVVVEELAQIACDTATYSTTGQGLQSVIDFICEGECGDGCIDLCADFEVCCESSDDGNDKGGSKPKGKQSADQY
ncbi:MAG: hypothetical protein AAFP76_16165 [Bacteroidota bacterium]